MQIRAATVWWAITNWDETLATNAFQVWQVGENPTLNGYYFQVGPRKFITPTGGFYTNVFGPGLYQALIYRTAYSNIFFAVPQGGGTYCMTNLLHSGANFYNFTPGVMSLTSTGGTVSVTSPVDITGSWNLEAIGGNATNAPTFLQSTNIAAYQALAATNALGSAAFTATTAYDASGAALNATNALGSAAFQPTTDFVRTNNRPNSMQLLNIGSGRYLENWDFIDMNAGTNINQPSKQLDVIDADFFTDPVNDMPKAGVTSGVLSGYWVTIGANPQFTTMSIVVLGPGYDIGSGGVQAGKYWPAINKPGPVDLVDITGGVYPGFVGGGQTNDAVVEAGSGISITTNGPTGGVTKYTIATSGGSGATVQQVQDATNDLNTVLRADLQPNGAVTNAETRNLAFLGSSNTVAGHFAVGGDLSVTGNVYTAGVTANTANFGLPAVLATQPAFFMATNGAGDVVMSKNGGALTNLQGSAVEGQVASAALAARASLAGDNVNVSFNQQDVDAYVDVASGSIFLRPTNGNVVIMQGALTGNASGATNIPGDQVNIDFAGSASTNAGKVTFTGSSGGGGTNAATTVLTFADPLATDLTVPEGAVTNGPRTFRVIATASFTLSNPSGTFTATCYPQSVQWEIKQDGTGGRIIAFGNKFRFSDGVGTPVLSTSPNYVDRIIACYDPIDDKWDVTGFARGFH